MAFGRHGKPALARRPIRDAFFPMTATLYFPEIGLHFDAYAFAIRRRQSHPPSPKAVKQSRTKVENVSGLVGMFPKS